ncbi:MAG TPA: patatin-like phospholipase family protein [Vicinamibacteria bacterium]|nr:patatin-like phospholipase family protein [Vicinamibacteria bacterium]
MREYSPKRRTALVLAGSGTSGAYHAGVVKALDESGVKVDLVVGSGAGTVGAAYAAAAGGPGLYGEDGFWRAVRWDSFFRLRAPLRVAVLLLATSFGVFLLPLFLALAAGLLFPLVLVADLAAPAWTAAVVQWLWAAQAALRTAYLAALSVPVFLLSALAVLVLGVAFLRNRRRFSEAFESVLDAGQARRRLSRGLWEIARGSTVSASAPSGADLGRRYVSLMTDNLGQPGFRELVLRATDLDTGAPLPFVLLREPWRSRFAQSRARGPRSRLDGIPGAVDLTAPGYDALLFEAVLTGLLPPPVAPVCRVAFPKGGAWAGEVHRLTDAILAGGAGIGEAVAAGAEQVLVATAVPEAPSPLPRRRGLAAAADAALSALERQVVERDLREAARMNRMVETLGHRTEDGGRAWQDPATGRVYRDLALYVVRPDRRLLGPLELDGARHPATEVLETADDLLEQGYRDAYRLFVEPVVGAAPETDRDARADPERRQPIEL